MEEVNMEQYFFCVEFNDGVYQVKEYTPGRSQYDTVIGKYRTHADAVIAASMFQSGDREPDVEKVLGYF
jgi:hypothetical protein